MQRAAVIGQAHRLTNRLCTAQLISATGTNTTPVRVPYGAPDPTSLQLLAIVIGLALTVSFGCSPCDNEYILSQKSPDGRTNAVVFTRSCGATTPVVTELSLQPADAGVPSGWPNALSLVDDPKAPIQRSTEAIKVVLKWETDRRLIVSYPRAAIAEKHANTIKGVSIEYRTF